MKIFGVLVALAGIYLFYKFQPFIGLTIIFTGLGIQFVKIDLKFLENIEYEQLVKYLLAGGIGFTFGALLFYIANLQYGYNPSLSIGIVFGSSFLGGITCGIFLGLIHRDLKKALKLGIAGGIGFLIGSFPIIYVLFDFLSFLYMGAIGGAFYGIVTKKIKKMAIAGSVGLFIGTLPIWIAIEIYSLDDGFIRELILFLIFSVTTGGFLGLGMYLAEKERTEEL